MSANNNPIFSKAPDIQWQGTPLTAANNTANLTSGTSYLVFTAGSDGGFVRELRLKPLPANNTLATVLRVWVNNGLPLATAQNSTLLGELAIPATTAAANAAQPDFVFPLGFALPAGYMIYVTLGTAPGGSGAFNCSVVGGKY